MSDSTPMGKLKQCVRLVHAIDTEGSIELRYEEDPSPRYSSPRYFATAERGPEADQNLDCFGLGVGPTLEEAISALYLNLRTQRCSDEPMPDKRRVVQIAVAANEDSGIEVEHLYALDSFGCIWEWCEETIKFTAGWAEVELPWKNKRRKKGAE